MYQLAAVLWPWPILPWRTAKRSASLTALQGQHYRERSCDSRITTRRSSSNEKRQMWASWAEFLSLLNDSSSGNSSASLTVSNYFKWARSSTGATWLGWDNDTNLRWLTTKPITSIFWICTIFQGLMVCWLPAGGAHLLVCVLSGRSLGPVVLPSLHSGSIRVCWTVLHFRVNYWFGFFCNNCFLAVKNLPLGTVRVLCITLAA